ncbi:MAG: hypothetical protein A3G32_04070 [Deltaproteobacteria bacterium RIFCSPLOWO2_12_FULL_40_28]|nr:MAG: hypothetical protein A3C45_06155 [Deltaproteobacteria bacterium RIFCSPHIGHO2_02_FULL_40_28]OGQ20497.1 MAG: hypothetical protein A3E27_01950 [Deltaproteobacteria bacterium RIFCSPHIGHO2_12_FULL_40_32]OGQ41127.1 MAG: hypothetical protein A3I69_08815 [Deltaproteobacteria bacterium RIFCSPLOWO2_02_FULL_40_36]OGQ55107.1 MAG: hypothetical protein A3G32_04070 [Deltaproteobacteria bacterium RIFCSPLOWO2_12_FULL_40_28]
MGSGYNESYVTATRDQSTANQAIAENADATDYDIAKLQSDAVVQQAKYDYMARIYEADKNYQIQMEALRVREKEAELQFKVDWKNAENDSIRAEASMRSADADYLEATAELTEAESEAEIDALQAAPSSSMSGHWYG